MATATFDITRVEYWAKKSLWYEKRLNEDGAIEWFIQFADQPRLYVHRVSIWASGASTVLSNIYEYGFNITSLTRANTPQDFAVSEPFLKERNPGFQASTREDIGVVVPVGGSLRLHCQELDTHASPTVDIQLFITTFDLDS